MEAEFMAMSDASSEALWWLQFMNEMGFSQKSVLIKVDSQSFIALATNTGSPKRA